jgi:translation initiation factor IF-1
MAKEELMEFQGTVVDVLPSTLFRVRLENGHEVLCHTCGKMRQKHIRVALGDSVSVQMSVYDTAKGRITYRHR